jgi:hypothetical protein
MKNPLLILKNNAYIWAVYFKKQESKKMNNGSNNGAKPANSIMFAPGDVYVLAHQPLGSKDLAVQCSDMTPTALLSIALAIANQANRMLVEKETAEASRIYLPPKTS